MATESKMSLTSSLPGQESADLLAKMSDDQAADDGDSNVTWTKRAFDILVGALLLLLTLPAIVLAAISLAVTLRAWPFFTQTRVGENGVPFQFVKLRTLPTHVPRYMGKYELETTALPWLSQTLRRLHLDELPQLLLVVTGRMSLVGPRPEMPYLHELLDDDYASLRTSVRPGCTGLWQVGVHCESMIHEHPEFDDYYVRNWSFRLDLWILGQTIRMMFPGAGRDRTQGLVRLSELPPWLTNGRSHRNHTKAATASSVEA